MIRSEIRRILGRKLALLISAAWVALVAILGAIFAEGEDFEGGFSLVEQVGLGAGEAAAIAAAVLGATAGTYDTDRGISRYLVLTGVGRTRMLANRVVGLAAVLALMVLPGTIVGIAIALSRESASTGEVIGALWSALAMAVTFGLVSLFIGTLFRSPGPAIAVSIVFLLGGAIIAAIVAEQVSESLADVLPDRGFRSLAEWGSSDLNLGMALLVSVAWLGAAFWLAHVRVTRSEY